MPMPTLARVLLSILVVLTIAPTVDARPKAGITFYTVERPVDTLGPLTGSGISVSCEEGDQVLSGGHGPGGVPDLPVSGGYPHCTRAWDVEISNFTPPPPRPTAAHAPRSPPTA